AAQCHTTRTPTLLRSCRRRQYGPNAVLSIAHANIVSPLASQHVPNRRCDPLRVAHCAVPRRGGVWSGIPPIREVEADRLWDSAGVSAPPAAAPSGVVTFLFTDVEGSTRRWENDADEMRTALAAHDQALPSAIESPG